MPVDLPGLYWDEARQRYFPLSSAPPSSRASIPHETKDRAVAPRKAGRRLFAHLHSSLWTPHKDRLIDRLRCSQFAPTDLTERVVMPLLPNGAAITAVQTVRHGDRVWSFVGDLAGWIYSSLAGTSDGTSYFPGRHTWQPEFTLSSEISSICVSNSKCIATSFGPDCRILYLPLDCPAQSKLIFRLPSRNVCDVWTADLQGSRLVLGARKQASLIYDIADCTRFHGLPTGSDVFAIAQQDQIVYTGLRNGSVVRFDTRIPSTADTLLDGLFAHKSNSVTNLRLLRDSQLLVSNVNGSISTFDLRRPSARSPTKVFTGNVNSYITKAPMAIDPAEDVLVVASQDRRIRLWSLRLGGPPFTSDTLTEPSKSHSLNHQFEHPIRALHISKEAKGMDLWAASGAELFKYRLGQRTSVAEDESQQP